MVVHGHMNVLIKATVPRHDFRRVADWSALIDGARVAGRNGQQSALKVALLHHPLLKLIAS